ncbi:hypothetical protein FOZ60_012123 [Perkinsus olseni]|uniref:Glutathione synthetase n=4 Tax=Perkinsus olseni TaxID=32597 RepID=A0A7J6ND75_PEROL|nr:hypothetical protein FOZ60_012123 [Perkinsus olseni]
MPELVTVAASAAEKSTSPRPWSLKSYEKSLRAMASSEAALRGCGAMLSSLGIAVIPESDTRPLRSAVLPVALLPRPFPARQFESAWQLGSTIAKLVDNISVDPQWLVDSLAEVVEADDFTRRLVDICRRVYIDGGRDHSKDIRIHLLRHDYLPTAVGDRLLQVEVNTIAAGFAGMGTQVSTFHRMTASAALNDLKPSQLPENKPIADFANAMAEAVSSYNEKFGRHSRTICMVVDAPEDNECDQRFIESVLLGNHGINVERRTMTELADHLSVDSQTHIVLIPSLIDPERMVEIALFYFRTGYGPNQYLNDSHWALRESLERSRAVMCPSVPQQLTGTKKVQQLWYSDPSVMTRFGLTEEEAERMREHFAVQVDPSVAKETVAAALKDPTAWVLKPQREGGGHNMYGDELVDALTTSSNDELKQFVLMERMLPAPLPCLAIDTPASREASRVVPKIISEGVSELGIYSALVMKGNHTVMDKPCGHMLRTKDVNVAEGGVHAGFSVIDSALLVDEDVSSSS